MAVKLEQKNELLKNFNALKALYNLEFVEEENLSDLLDQLAENMYNNTADLSKAYPDMKHYQNYRLKQSLENDRNRSIAKLVLFRGS
ncbi:MAG: hypothetical protein H7647_06425 [Candidatus Heimdallarchaeota archaeon]|nr:hypothetical protein [Candidatus Heimdallarchaeota archaeon]MCK4254060.1 hypothetical protein [Candidatus Heimdallarchaeota archaeon]